MFLISRYRSYALKKEEKHGEGDEPARIRHDSSETGKEDAAHQRNSWK